MNCEELRSEYTTYALGIAGDPERGEIAEHLSRNCPVCVPGVTSAMATVSAMSGGVSEIEPPKRLRRRVIALVQPAPKRAWFAIAIPWALAAALTVALISVVLPGRREAANAAKLEQALSILNDPSAKDVTFGVTGKPSKGRVFVSRGRGVVFIAASLPRLASDKIFELWVIPAGGKPVPGGTFQSEPDATAVYVRSGPIDINAAAIAVTVEPAGGSPQPTTTPFIVAGLT
jgi:hypothetical protein